MAYEAKTKVTEVGVDAFLDTVEPPVRRQDGKALCALMRQVTGEEPRMWGPSIVGFGRYRYRYESGHFGEAPRMGFSPRKPKLVLYLPMSDDRAGFLGKLGKHARGKSCLYINKLADVDAGVLDTLVRHAWASKTHAGCD
jgi:hypothetical protein